MQYKKYQHIEKIGREEIDGLLDGECYIFPKIDGTNSVVYMGDDGVIHAGSRNRELTLENDNAGFCKFAYDNDSLKRYVTKHPNHYVYGEWLVKHTITYYNSEAWRKFYIFDVLEVNGDQYRWLPYEEYEPLLIEFNLLYIPLLKKINKPKVDTDLKNCLNENHYLIDDKNKIGEGIVIKSYDYTNKYGHVIWGKIIAEEFFRTKHELKAKRRAVRDSGSLEEVIIAEYVTEIVIRKEYAKIKELIGDKEHARNEIIGRTLNQVWDNFINEDLKDAIKKHKNPTINFDVLKHLCNQEVKDTLPELF